MRRENRMKTRFQIILLLVVAGFVTNVQRQGVLIPDQFPPLKRWALAWNGYEFDGWGNVLGG